MKNKSVVKALLIGFFTVMIATTIVDILLHLAGVFPPVGTAPLTDSLSAVALSYRIVIGILGGYVTARLAPEKPMKYALILGAIGFVVASIGAIALKDKGLGPMWYSVAIAVLSIPQCWIGAKIYEIQNAQEAK